MRRRGGPTSDLARGEGSTPSGLNLALRSTYTCDCQPALAYAGLMNECLAMVPRFFFRGPAR
ncbi:hypothetical protein HMPREF0972_00222 [Actinomyces sp. oral taxon 848 str. F0332]|nr:hypothetical protein HMPREF0972_00222 [Actinomyces sp. oral taxon 848 str. F0332]